MTNQDNKSKIENNESENRDDVKKIKRRIIDWLHKYAHDEEVYEIARFYRIKIN